MTPSPSAAPLRQRDPSIHNGGRRSRTNVSRETSGQRSKPRIPRGTSAPPLFLPSPLSLSPAFPFPYPPASPDARKAFSGRLLLKRRRRPSRYSQPAPPLFGRLRHETASRNSSEPRRSRQASPTRAHARVKGDARGTAPRPSRHAGCRESARRKPRGLSSLSPLPNPLPPRVWARLLGAAQGGVRSPKKVVGVL